jgi:equilibrative nucleoside transporter 1/2/3
MQDSHDRLLLGEILLQGIGSLINWNSILASLDWYNNRFIGYDSAFWIPLLNYLPALIFQPLTIAYGNRYTFNMRIVIPYIVIACILILTPIVVELAPGLTGFIIVCLMTSVMGCMNAIGQTSTFGLAGTMPDKYTNMVMLGSGLSGLLITLIRLICLFTFPQTSTGYLLSTTVYFIISGATLILCSVAQIHLMKNPLVIQCLSKVQSKETEKGEPLTTAELDSFKGPEGFHHKDKTKINYKVLFHKIWQYAFLIWLNYVITFGMLSHVSLATEGE